MTLGQHSKGTVYPCKPFKCRTGQMAERALHWGRVVLGSGTHTWNKNRGWELPNTDLVERSGEKSVGWSALLILSVLSWVRETVTRNSFQLVSHQVGWHTENDWLCKHNNRFLSLAYSSQKHTTISNLDGSVHFVTPTNRPELPGFTHHTFREFNICP